MFFQKFDIQKIVKVYIYSKRILPKREDEKGFHFHVFSCEGKAKAQKFSDVSCNIHKFFSSSILPINHGNFRGLIPYPMLVSLFPYQYFHQ